jgi:hypothetical protein
VIHGLFADTAYSSTVALTVNRKYSSTVKDTQKISEKYVPNTQIPAKYPHKIQT